MSTRRALATEGFAASCYFRSSVTPPHRKALLQITERCNLHCAHCFVSAGDYGDAMSLEAVTNVLIPRLIECRVTSVTLTGGEPFAHPELLEICRAMRAAALRVGVCTNATLTTDEQIEQLRGIGGIHVNVSLDGFAASSHGRFRGAPDSFATTTETVRRFGKAGLLQGLLATPNRLAEVHEYRELCDFAVACGAQYVLMNPLSRMGRGTVSQRSLSAADSVMREIVGVTSGFDPAQLDVVHIRFPNSDRPLAGCEAGTIVYVFCPGELTVCPYLVFAARTPGSAHRDEEFIVGNIFHDANIAARLDRYKFHDRYKIGANATCGTCDINSQCGKGCPAAVIATGGRIGDLDREVCPKVEPEVSVR